MVVAEQVGDTALVQGGDRFGNAAAEVADGGQRVAEGGHGACDGGPQCAFVFGSNLEREQDPAGEPVQAQEGAALALVTGGVEMQDIALRHGGAQGRGALPVQGFEGQQEAIAQRGHRTAGQGDAAPGEFGLNLSALEAAVIAGQADPRDQVVAETLARRGQLGQPLRGRHGVAAVGPAMGAEFVRHERADGRVTSTRDWLLYGVRARPQCRQWVVSAAKSRRGGVPFKSPQRAMLSALQPASKAWARHSVSRA